MIFDKSITKNRNMKKTSTLPPVIPEGYIPRPPKDHFRYLDFLANYWALCKFIKTEPHDFRN